MQLTLKQTRLIKEKTQGEMAQMLGIHIQTYRKLEENPENVTIGQAKKISSFLKISYNDIFFAD
ncbi:MAG: helix-turn-helix transcriptional regulator [Phascolarctobacterium sp.]|nr:helix-turn-helix transcriptional regulator [Phascolarctobacterium sp.]